MVHGLVSEEVAVTGPVSAITGEPCEDVDRRPIAVMLASDPEARPLSGLNSADMVFEMPVTPDGITRLMGVFQCEEPSEIGSVRSARGDFLPLAAGMSAILAHWGGERDTLKLLSNGIMDNIDAMKFEGTVFYRKRGVRPPHNGFTTLEKLLTQAVDLKYSTENGFVGYPHTTGPLARTISNITTSVKVDYQSPFDILWLYDNVAGVYRRVRGGQPEIDAIDGSQITAGVVVVMETESKFLRDQYISVSVVGRGRATVYQDGIAISGTWKKEDARSSKLTFLDANGQEIKFMPGKVWVEIITSHN